MPHARGVCAPEPAPGGETFVLCAQRGNQQRHTAPHAIGYMPQALRSTTHPPFKLYYTAHAHSSINRQTVHVSSVACRVRRESRVSSKHHIAGVSVLPVPRPVLEHQTSRCSAVCWGRVVPVDLHGAASRALVAAYRVGSSRARRPRARCLGCWRGVGGRDMGKTSAGPD